jgi:hypothetical protein
MPDPWLDLGQFFFQCWWGDLVLTQEMACWCTGPWLT